MQAYRYISYLQCGLAAFSQLCTATLQWYSAAACTVQLIHITITLLQQCTPSAGKPVLIFTTCLNRLWAEAVTVCGTDAVLQCMTDRNYACMTDRNYACMEEVCHVGACIYLRGMLVSCMPKSAQSCTEAMHQCHRLSQPLLQRSCFNLSVCVGAACIAASSACAIL